MRNFKSFGLALIAVFAFGAIVATAASAAEFHSGSTNTTQTVSANKVQEFTYQSGGEIIECTKVKGEAQTTTQTTKEVTFKPKYENCKAKELALTAHVKMNSCDYLFTISATKTQGETHVNCGADQITIQVTDVFGGTFCTISVGKQTPVGEADYANSGASEITVTPTQTGIKGSRTGSAFCGGQQSTTGSYTGDVTVTGEITGQQTMTNIQVS